MKIENINIIILKELDNKIPIPNVCKEFDLKICDLYQMLRDLNFRF
ncbi:MAG: hypothetical protein KatS3mg129_2861 [Leptospiraceae bacterium]|jgi:hypothetical protein|nr:MAG: hypothetical protein KatS3mg129_2861 [Leptospiraceae bacterium]